MEKRREKVRGDIGSKEKREEEGRGRRPCDIIKSERGGGGRGVFLGDMGARGERDGGMSGGGLEGLKV